MLIGTNAVCMYLCENRVYTKETGAISTTLKTGENRYVSVSSSVMELLRRWKAEQAEFFRVLGVTPTDYIMTTDNGQPGMREYNDRDWQRSPPEGEAGTGKIDRGRGLVLHLCLPEV